MFNINLMFEKKNKKKCELMFFFVRKSYEKKVMFFSTM